VFDSQKQTKQRRKEPKLDKKSQFLTVLNIESQDERVKVAGDDESMSRFKVVLF
jgi:hypothetical protein